MSISALSSNLITDLSQQAQNPFQQIRQDFKQLDSALQSGNLSDAQSAYSSIEQLLQANGGSSNSNTTSNGSNALQNDFAALGQALQSGDLSQAQSAFSQLQSDFQAGRESGGSTPPAQDQYVSSASQGQNPVQEALEDYTQLASALQSGDLTDAQSAYTSLQQLVQANAGSSNSTTTSNGSNVLQTDFATLGQDLQSNNLTEAQSAFSQLQSDLLAATQPATQGTGATTQAQSVTTPSQTQTIAQQVQQDYTELTSALESDSLTNAQTAFTALQQALQTQTGTSAASSTNSNNSTDPIANDLNAVGQALSSGNLSQAQSAFSQLQTDINAAQQSGPSQAQSATQWHQAEGHHHHHHGGGGYSTSTTAAADSTSNTNSGVSIYA